MSILAISYYVDPEGQRFLAARDIRVMLAVTGILAAYVLLRLRPRLPTGMWAVGRAAVAGAAAAALWLGVDWVRDEDWVCELLATLPDLPENGIRYSVLVAAGWLGWSVALYEGLRWAEVVRRWGRAE